MIVIFKDLVHFISTNPTVGVTLGVLALASIYSWALVLNQAFYLLSNRENVRELVVFLEDDRKDVKDLEMFAATKNTPHRRLVAAGLKHINKGPETLMALLNEEAKALRWEAEQRLAGLGTLGNIAPFIGLFGTVLGVIRAFYAIKDEMGGGMSAVKGGIAEALVSTAAGLVVAIPAVIFYNYFLKRARRLSIELERVATLLVHRTRT